MGDRIPWQYSTTAKQYYIYRSRTDELVFQDGRAIPRPNALAPNTLEDATWNGALPAADYSQSPDDRGNYSTERSARAGPAYGPAATPRTTTRSPAYSVPETSNELASRLKSMNINQALQPMPERQVGHLLPVQVDRAGPRQDDIRKAEVLGDMSTEKLYPDYKIRKKDFFFPGKIFSILWAEPAGTTANTEVTSREEAVVLGPYNEPIYSKIRRFVVIRAGDGYCNALPITTYGGRGVGKRGVKKSEHAIIYTNPMPKPLSNERPDREEEPMRPFAIRVDPDTKAEKLDPMSRVNLGHPHTIQHNVKVKSCGKVAQESFQDLIDQFRNVFNVYKEPASASGSSKRASGTSSDVAKVAAALRSLLNDYSRIDAMRKTSDTLIEKGYTEAQAADVIREALIYLKNN